MFVVIKIHFPFFGVYDTMKFGRFNSSCFKPEEGHSMFFQNVHTHLPEHMMYKKSQHELQSSYFVIIPCTRYIYFEKKKFLNT